MGSDASTSIPVCQMFVVSEGSVRYAYLVFLFCSRSFVIPSSRPIHTSQLRDCINLSPKSCPAFGHSYRDQNTEMLTMSSSLDQSFVKLAGAVAPGTGVVKSGTARLWS